VSNEQDVFEWRRFGHWASSAAKARFSAFVLSHTQNYSRLTEMVNVSNHQSGDADLALVEAFKRESAVALELVVKAVIAHKLQARGADPASEGVPATHDLPKLWEQAKLPQLPADDLYRLHLVKSVLMWSGRYATPRTVKDWSKENKAFDTLEKQPLETEGFVIRTPITFGWADFDRLYQIAHGCL
jgi:hypothetical protein